MNTALRRSAVSPGSGQCHERERGERRGSLALAEEEARNKTNGGAEPRARVYIAAENRLLREALSRMLTRQDDIDVVGLNCAGPFRVEGLIEEKVDILLLTPRGSLAEDIFVIRQARLTAPTVRILLVGMTEDETEFFQYVRAGIRGVPAKRGLGGGRPGSHESGACGRRGVPRVAVRIFVPVL